MNPFCFILILTIPPIHFIVLSVLSGCCGKNALGMVRKAVQIHVEIENKSDLFRVISKKKKNLR